MIDARDPLRPAQALEAVIALVKPKWAVAVLAALAGGPLRHGDLHAEVNDHHRRPSEPPMSHKVFMDTVTALTDAGLIEKHKERHGFPVISWYRLTHHGRGFIAATWPLVRWYQHYASPVTDTEPDAENGSAEG